jgi:hypothetical protein
VISTSYDKQGENKVLRDDILSIRNAINNMQVVYDKTVTTTPYTALDSDYLILADAQAASITINLPTAAGRKGKIFQVKKVNANANTVTLDAFGSQTIDGALTQVLSVSYSSISIYSDNANWWII